jgi:ligand-binding sensor domain-containing protein
LIFYNRKEFVSYTVDNGLASNSINHVYQDNTGNIWVGTRSGLSFYNEGRFISYTAREGLTPIELTM